MQAVNQSRLISLQKMYDHIGSNLINNKLQAGIFHNGLTLYNS